MPYDRASYAAGSAHLVPQLLADGDYTTRKVTILSGNTLTRGTVIGKITTGGKYIKSLSAASDGSQTPDMILGQDTDASGGDVEALAYETGKFNAAALTLGTAHTIATIREGLRGKGILIDD